MAFSLLLMSVIRAFPVPDSHCRRLSETKVKALLVSVNAFAVFDYVSILARCAAEVNVQISLSFEEFLPAVYGILQKRAATLCLDGAGPG
jgi:hypothetical protein